MNQFGLSGNLEVGTRVESTLGRPSTVDTILHSHLAALRLSVIRKAGLKYVVVRFFLFNFAF